MSLKQRRLVAAVVLAAALLSSGTAVVLHRADAQKPAVPAERKGPAAKGQEAAGELTGFVESVDAARNTLTLANKQTGAKTFAVAQDARVFLDDGSGGKLGFTEGKLADLTSGLTVTVRLARDGNTVLRVWAEGPVVRGVLKSVDAGKRTLTVTYTEKKGDAEREGTYEVAAEAPITIQAGKSKEKGCPGRHTGRAARGGRRHAEAVRRPQARRQRPGRGAGNPRRGPFGGRREKRRHRRCRRGRPDGPEDLHRPGPCVDVD